MKKNRNKLKEAVLNAYFAEGADAKEIAEKYIVGTDTVDYWVKEASKTRTKTKTPPNAASTYQSEADNEFHIFLKQEPFLLDMPHYHESVEMIFVLKGAVTAHVGGKTYRVNEGEICFANKFQNHFYKNQTAEFQAVCLVLSRDFTHHLRQQFKDRTPPPFMSDKTYNEKLFAVIKKWVAEENRTYLLNCAYANLLFDAVTKTYGVFETEETGVNRLAIDFIDYIKNNYRSDISLVTMSAHFGYTKEYCSKLFNKAVGQSFNDFLNSVRVQKVVETMNEKDSEHRKITDVIYECGFNSQVTFYRHYKKYQDKIQASKKYERTI